MKKLFVIAILVLVVGIGAFVWKGKTSITATSENKLFITESQLKGKDFLKDKQAVLYYSTTADQDFDNKGMSYAIFIDDQGEASAYQMTGLELGMITKGENQLLLSEKNKLTLVGENYNDFPQEKPQYTGERTGYLKKNQMFFSIYNTGMNTQNGGYDSNVLFGNEKVFHFDNIPYYILTSGMTDEMVPILTYDVEKNEYDLREVTFDETKLAIEDITRLQNKENSEYANLSPIVTDDQFYYFVLSEFVGDNSGNVVLYKINKQTKEEEKILLAQYENSDKTYTSIPYNVKSSAHIYQNTFYYIDGLGDVYSLEKDAKEISKRFTIENPAQDGVRHGEGTFFQDDQLYVVRNDVHTDKGYFIEKYSLLDGKKQTEIPIKNISEILAKVKGKSVHAYDFKILK
jgi:hypothetical protein